MNHTHLLSLAAGVLLAGSLLALPTVAEPPHPPSLKIESQQRDSYNWADRHAAVLARNRAVKPDVVILGDSITHFWGGEPKGPAVGPASWAALFDGLTVTNLGFGFDYADNAYYRVLHGELDNITPRVILVNIGTNNLGHRRDTAEATAANVAALVRLIANKQPRAKILILGIYPRRNPALLEPIRETNRRLAKLADNRHIFYADPGRVLAGTDGRADPKAMRDDVHPNATGYHRLAEAIRPTLRKLLAPTPKK